MMTPIFNHVEKASFRQVLHQFTLFIKGLEPDHVFKPFIQVPQVYANLVHNEHVDLEKFDSCTYEMLYLAEIIVSKGVLICACQMFYDNKLVLEDPVWIKDIPKATYCPFLEGICGKDSLDQLTRNADQHDYPYFWYDIGSKEVHFSAAAKTSFDVVVFYDECGRGVADQSYKLSTNLSLRVLSRVTEFHLAPEVEGLFWFLFVETNMPLERDNDASIARLAGDLSFFRNLLKER
jgi:hypothetical protein